MFRTVAAACFVGSAVISQAACAQSFPNREISLVIPAQIATSDDLVARGFAAHLTRELGQKVAFQNIGSADGVLGADTVAKAAPDGYTLLFGNSSTHAFYPATTAKFPFDPVTDFTPIIRLFEDRIALLVSDRSATGSIASLLETCRKPGSNMSYGIFGPQAVSSFPGAVLNGACGGTLNPRSV